MQLSGEAIQKLSAFFKEARRKAGKVYELKRAFTLEEMYYYYGVSISTYSKIENGKIKDFPKRETIDKIIHLCNHPDTGKPLSRQELESYCLDSDLFI